MPRARATARLTNTLALRMPSSPMQVRSTCSVHAHHREMQRRTEKKDELPDLSSAVNGSGGLPVAAAQGGRPGSPAHRRLCTRSSAYASAPTPSLRTASTASLPHCILSSLPSLPLPSSCTAAGTQPDRAAPRAPHHPHDARHTTHCRTIFPQSPRARSSWLLLALEERGKGREANKSQHASAYAHCPSSPGAPPRTSRPRGCSVLALSSASTTPAPASCLHS